MSRQIRFRAWSHLQSRFLPHDEIVKTACSFNGGEKIQPLSNILFIFGTEGLDWIFQQSTGLLDNQGGEIYEGDIVSYDVGYPNQNYMNERKSEVKFENGAFYPRPFTERNDDDNWYEYEVRNLKIIGNIFETPELLA